MTILVHKYGGSSLATFDKLKAVAKKIADTKAQGHELVVVVSAMGNTTNELLEKARAITPNPSKRELDMLLSVGERISMALLSMALHEYGYEATSLTGSQCGIITTDSHSAAKIMDVRPFRVQDELARGRIVIVAGYQGTSYRREVTTLGRGGSDTTAVALAAALGATCHIYSDVDGVYSADPRKVLNAQKLATLSYDEMLEMARGGAKVLNEDAVAFAKGAKIALHAKATHMPESPGTVIRPDGFLDFATRAEAGRIHPIAVVEHHQCLWINGPTSALLEATKRLPCIASSLSLDSSWVLISTTDIHRLDNFIEELHAKSLETKSEVAAVSLVGESIGTTLNILSEARELLNSVSISFIGYSVLRNRISFILKASQAKEVTQLLHDSFCLDPHSA